LNYRSKVMTATLLGLLLILGGCGGTSPVNPGGVSKRVAVYNGTGADGRFAGAVKAALEDAGRTVDLVDEAQCQSDLSAYGLVVISAGDPVEMAGALGFTGIGRIKGLVESGGGYIGLGAGAYLAADSISYHGSGALATPLGLLHGLAQGPIPGIGSGMLLTSVSIVDVEFDPGTGTTFQVLYYDGPSIEVREAIPLLEIARFNSTQGLATIGFGYGLGRVIACAVHPEIEENDDRDGTDVGSDLVDPESEWFYLQRLAAWCLHEILL